MAKTAKKGEPSAKPKEKKLPQKKVRVRNQVKKGPHGGTLVVLVDDTAHVGKQGEVVEVKPGYARNYLIPYGKAVIPSPENLRTLDQYKIKVEKARVPAVTIEANATEEGHLYGSIGPIEISKTLKGKNLKVEPEMVKLENPIKEANTLTEVPLTLGYGIEAKIQVLVVALQARK
jgi:large subunit ribosomal protein L9